MEKIIKTNPIKKVRTLTFDNKCEIMEIISYYSKFDRPQNLDFAYMAIINYKNNSIENVKIFSKDCKQIANIPKIELESFIFNLPTRKEIISLKEKEKLNYKELTKLMLYNWRVYKR